MTPAEQEQVSQMEQIHLQIQDTCNQTLTLGLLATQLACVLTDRVKAWKASRPAEASLEELIDATFTENFASWLPEYHKIAELPFAEKIENTKASVVQKAFKILDIIPAIVQEEK